MESQGLAFIPSDKRVVVNPRKPSFAAGVAKGSQGLGDGFVRDVGVQDANVAGAQIAECFFKTMAVLQASWPVDHAAHLETKRNAPAG